MNSDAADLVRAVRSVLEAHADPERAVGQQRYMRSTMPFRGLATPARRAALRPVLAEHRLTRREDWEQAIRALWDGATHREERYAAVDLLRHRAYRPWRDAGLVGLLAHLVRTGAWWDLVDAVAPVLGEILRADPEVATTIRAWAVADSLWMRRAAIISQLDSRALTDVALLEDCLDPNLDDRDFFVRKAIGWALRQHGRTDPVWVRAYVQSRRGRLSALSAREALRHLA